MATRSGIHLPSLIPNLLQLIVCPPEDYPPVAGMGDLSQRLSRQAFRLARTRLTTEKQLEYVTGAQVKIGLLAIVRPV